jgi:hypothetical protein
MSKEVYKSVIAGVRFICASAKDSRDFMSEYKEFVAPNQNQTGSFDKELCDKLAKDGFKVLDNSMAFKYRSFRNPKTGDVAIVFHKAFSYEKT